eukprot:m.93162 g.93162  ORF g.93162 m.93162 type:complete len:878 (-) comp26612_c0_seq1:128-2761(-)
MFVIGMRSLRANPFASSSIWVLLLGVSLMDHCDASHYIINVATRDEQTIEFDGVGGLSGGGGCSRLLPDYPSEQQSQILDYLFKPNFGASLHVLKVEIGGDAQSTDGTEASHRHTETETPNYNRGYEWFVMKEAKKRNPAIKLYALPWAWPGWLGVCANSTNDIHTSTVSGNPLACNTKATAEYVVDWLQGAKVEHNLTIDYVSIWNEMDNDLKGGGVVYVKQLRKSLDARGLDQVKIVAFDGHSFSLITDTFKEDQEMIDAVYAVGAHYPGTHGPGPAALGKKAWSSEDYSQLSSTSIGGMCWARVINRNFISGNLTATIAWNLVDSYYDGLAFSNKGLMRANKPWSGHYIVDTPIWASAHTTQFTSPGWRYLPVGAGSGWLEHGGSYVTLVAPPSGASDIDGTTGAPDVTMVIEKMDPKLSACEWEGSGNTTTPISETATFQLLGYPGIKTLRLWKSDLSSANSNDVFVNGGVVNVVDGAFSLDVNVSCIYTLTTITTGQKGFNFSIPADTGFFDNIKAPYTDNFDHYNLSSEAAFFSDMSGSWEIVESNTGGHGKVMQQMVPRAPVFGIRSEVRPISLIGESTFGDTTLAIDFMLPNSNVSVFIGTNFRGLTDGPGVFLHIGALGWDVATTVSKIGSSPSVFGTNVTATPTTWHRLNITIFGGDVTAWLDNTSIVSSLAMGAANGWAVIGTGGYDGGVQFDNVYLNATSNAPPPSPPGPPGPHPPGPSPPPGPGPPASPCKQPYKGQKLFNLPCKIGASYVGWEGVGSGLISSRNSSNLCITTNGDALELGDCGSAVQWLYSSSTFKLTTTKDTTKCIDINMHSTPMNAAMWTCNNDYDGGANEKFQYDSVSGQLQSEMPGPSGGGSECLAVCL